MSNIVTSEEVLKNNYDNAYNIKYTNININNLYKEGVEEGLIDGYNLESFLLHFEDEIIVYLNTVIEYDEEADMGFEIKRRVKDVYDAINDYLSTFDSPYEAFKYMVNPDQDKIGFCLNRYENLQKELAIKIFKLKKISSIAIQYNVEYRDYYNYLKDRIYNSSLIAPMYLLICLSENEEITNLERLNKVMDIMILEGNILNRFGEKEVTNFLKSFQTHDVGKNITLTSLYNYVFNALYKDGATLQFSENMCSLIMREIKNGMISIEDVEEVIGDSKLFNEEEIDYIRTYFYPKFHEEIIDNKYLDRFIKTK